MKPRTRSSPPINALQKPRVSESVRVRNTAAIGSRGEAAGIRLGLGLRFAQADVGQLRIGEQAIGNQPSACGAVAAREVAEDDAKIVVADVRELRTAGTVAYRPNVGGSCFPAGR